MGCLLILNDSEENIYWKKNIHKLENFILSESLIQLFLSFVALLTFPFDSFNITKQNTSLIPINYIIISIIFCSFISFFMSLLIKYIPLNNDIKPNYLLFIMKVFSYIGFFSFFMSFISSFYITLVIIEWEKYKGSIVLKSFSSHNNKSINIWKAIFTLNWSNMILLCSILSTFDFCAECIIFSKACKYLSEGNNINNKKVLNELFIKSKAGKQDKKSDNNVLNDINEIQNENKICKYRIVMIENNNINNSENYFRKKDDKFQEVEMILNIEYISEGTQTDDLNNDICNNYANTNNNINQSIDDDLSNNSILAQNRPLIND